VLIAGLLAYILSPQWRSFDRMGEQRFTALGHLPKEILVGVCWPFSVNQDGMADGLQLALEEINAGNLAGIPVRLILRDDAFDLEKVKDIAIEFSENPKMSAVIGYYDDIAAIKASTMYEPARLLHLVVGANNTPMTAHGFNYIIRTIVSNDKIALSLARIAIDRGYRKFALIWEENAYGEDLAYQFTVGLNNFDAQIVYEWSYARERADFRIAVNQLKSVDADVIFFAGLEPWAGDFLREARAVGVKTDIIGAFSDTPEMRAKAGRGLEGAMYFDMYDVYSPSPENQAFVRKFKTRFGKKPDAWAAQGYDALRILAKAVRETRSANPLDLSYAIRYMAPWEGANGRYKFDSRGELEDKPIYLNVFRNGNPVTIQKSRPVPAPQFDNDLLMIVIAFEPFLELLDMPAFNGFWIERGSMNVRTVSIVVAFAELFLWFGNANAEGKPDVDVQYIQEHFPDAYLLIYREGIAAGRKEAAAELKCGTAPASTAPSSIASEASAAVQHRPAKESLGKWWEKSSLKYSPLPEGWLFHFEGSLDYKHQSGNISSNLYDGSATLKVRKHRFTNTLALIINKQSTAQILSPGSAAVQIDNDYHSLQESLRFDLTKRLYADVGYTWEKDTVNYIEHRNIFYSGMGYAPIDTRRHSLEVFAAGGYEKVQFPDLVKDFVNLDHLNAAALFFREDYRWNISDRIAYKQTFRIIQNFQKSLIINADQLNLHAVGETYRYRWFLLNEVYLKLVEHLNFSSGSKIEYNNNPWLMEKKLDVTVKSGIQFSF